MDEMKNKKMVSDRAAISKLLSSEKGYIYSIKLETSFM